MALRFQFFNAPAATWTGNNPVLLQSEMGIESDTQKFKIGDGVTAWNSLPYGGIAGADGATGAAGVGVPAGGTTGQVLGKIDATDYNDQWIDAPAGTPSGTVAALDGTGAAGAASAYSRGDHKHADSARHTHSNSSALALVSGTNTGNQDLSGLALKTTTVNGHALS